MLGFVIYGIGYFNVDKIIKLEKLEKNEGCSLNIRSLFWYPRWYSFRFSWLLL